jgi:hypothetical protein
METPHMPRKYVNRMDRCCLFVARLPDDGKMAVVYRDLGIFP